MPGTSFGFVVSRRILSFHDEFRYHAIFGINSNEVCAGSIVGSVHRYLSVVYFYDIQHLTVNVVNLNAIDYRLCVCNGVLTAGWVRIYVYAVDVVVVDTNVGGMNGNRVGRIRGQAVGAVGHYLDLVIAIAVEIRQCEWYGSGSSGAPSVGICNFVLNGPVVGRVSFLIPSLRNGVVLNVRSSKICWSRTNLNSIIQGGEEYRHGPVGGVVGVASSLYAYEVLGVGGQTGEVVVWCSVYNHAGPVETLLVFVFEVPGGFVATSGPMSACGGLSDVVNS